MRILALAVAMLIGTGAANAAVQTKVVEYKQGDAVLEGYLAWDDAVQGRRPGVLVVHEWTGLGDYAKTRARKLAEMGYVAFAADIYGKGIRPKTPQEAAAQAGNYKKDRALMRARTPAGLDGPARQSDVRSQAGGGHRLLLRRHLRVGTRPQRRRRRRRRQLPRRPGHPDPGRREEHQVQGPGPARRRRSACARARTWRPSRTRCGPAAWTGSLWSTAGRSTASRTRPSGNDKSRGVAYDAEADRRSWEAMKAFFAEVLK